MRTVVLLASVGVVVACLACAGGSSSASRSGSLPAAPTGPSLTPGAADEDVANMNSDEAGSKDPAMLRESSDPSVIEVRPLDSGNSVQLMPRKKAKRRSAIVAFAYRLIGSGSGLPPSPSRPPSPSPSSSPSPSPGSCNFQAGCTLSIIYTGNLSGPTDFNLYFTSGSTTCAYPKWGSGVSSSLCFGPGCNGGSQRTASRQFSTIPRFSSATVYLARTPSTSPGGTGRSVNLAACSPSSISFP